MICFVLRVFQVNEECSTLRVSLAEAQHEREIARNEVSNLHYKVSSLENLVKVSFIWCRCWYSISTWHVKCVRLFVAVEINNKFNTMYSPICIRT